MFKFLHEEVAWKVDFVHEKHDPPIDFELGTGKKRKVIATTYCNISKQNGDYLTRYAYGEARCLEGDMFSRSTGRGIALASALRKKRLVKIGTPPLENPRLEAKWVPLFPRASKPLSGAIDFRRLVWSCYWVMANRLDRVTADDLRGAVAALQAAGTKIPGKLPPCQTYTGTR